MPAFYGAVDLSRNELRNAVVQNLGAAPGSPVAGLLYYDSTQKVLFWYDGTTWQSAKGGVVISTTVTTQAIGDAAAAGASTQPSAGDHRHGMPAFGGVTGDNTAFGTAAGAGVGTTLSRSDHNHGNPAHDTPAHSAIPLSGLAVPTAAVNLNNQKIINLADPTNPQDGASKNYVDITAQGLDAKQSVRAASTGNLTQSGTQTVDGVALVANDRVLCKDQTSAPTNGIWIVQSGAWTRATDMDAWTEVPGAFTFVEQGTVNADSGWVCTADQGGTIGTTNITWVQFSGAGQITAGAGLTKTGNQIDFVAGDTSLTVAADSAVVNTAVIATVAALNAAMAGVTKKFSAALGGTTGAGEVVNHNLNTRDVSVTVYNGASPYTAVFVDWDATTVNSITVRYNPNLGAGYRVVVIG